MHVSRKYFLLFSLLLSANASVYAQSKRKIDSLASLLLKAAEDTHKVNLLISISKEYGKTNPDKSLEYGEQALSLSGRLNYKEGQAKSLNRIGFSYYNRAQYSDAIEYYSRSLKITHELKDSAREAGAFNNIARAYEAQGLYEKALENYLSSLKLNEAIKDRTGMALAYLNLGNLYLNKTDVDQAYLYYKKCLDITAEIKDSLILSSCMNNISIILRKQKKYDEATKFQERAFLIKEKIGDTRGLVNGWGNMGKIYLAKKDFKRALDFFGKAYDGNLKMNSRFEMSMLLDDMGDVFAAMKKYPLAIEYYNRARSLSKEIRAKEVERDACLHLAQAYYEVNDPAKAYEHLRLYTELKDTLLNEENQKNITLMQTLYETEKKDNEIRLLNKDNEIQSSELHKRAVVLWAGAAVLLLIILLSIFIYRSYKQKQKANLLLERKSREIERQKNIIENKNKEIIDSINYASRIQTAVLPRDSELNNVLPGCFVLFKPKDIVSGDFYWVSEINGHTFYVAADCTGHGVPGGFMSMLGISLLNEIVNEKKIQEPADILDMMRVKIIMSLRQKGETGENKDGMDMVLCRLNRDRTELLYAAANNPLWMVRNGVCTEFPANKQPVGISTEHAGQFSQKNIPLRPGDLVYIFTDGYADQFGGLQGKKFKYRQLRDKILSIHSLAMEEQKSILEKTFDNWKGSLEQVDDICIIGIRV